MDINEFEIKSDIHIDFYVDPVASNRKNQIYNVLERIFKESTKKKLICAGDISNNLQDILWTYEWFTRRFEETYVIFGNHDMMLEPGINWETKISRTVQFSNNFQSLHILDGNIVNNIGGCFGYYQAMEDFKINTKSYFEWRNFWFDGRYWDVPNMDIDNFVDRENRKLRSMLLNGAEVIVTHCIPIQQGIPDKYKDSNTNKYFYFNATDLLENYVRNDLVWVTGHTHERASNDYVNKNGHRIKFICEPYGYPHENISQKTIYKNN